MIKFSVVSCPKYIKKIPKGYPELTEYEFDFSIVINGKLFFKEPNFPVFEFLYFVNDWKGMTNCSFEYFSFETEDNPLISFIFENNFWSIRSPWQLFKCQTKFTKQQLTEALNKLETQIWRCIFNS